MTKYVFVTGGVVSGLGKGIVAASLGRLLKCRGYKVKAQKLDPYLNVDPGTMNPIQHGEVFVTEDGAETDLDLGHYERFMDENLSKASNLTSGRVYERVLARERAGEYLGQTVQIIPHVTGEIKRFIEAGGKGADVLITEIGGTTGDIESLPFIEAARQFAAEKANATAVLFTSYSCRISAVRTNTSPSPRSTRSRNSGSRRVSDVVVMRADTDPAKDSQKLAMFCSLDPSRVVLSETVDCLYKAPLALHARGLDTAVCKTLGLKAEPDLSGWINTVEKSTPAAAK
ncbi:MAG: CTP synthase [Christensenellales bacterium]